MSATVKEAVCQQPFDPLARPGVHKRLPGDRSPTKTLWFFGYLLIEADESARGTRLALVPGVPIEITDRSHSWRVAVAWARAAVGAGVGAAIFAIAAALSWAASAAAADATDRHALHRNALHRHALHRHALQGAPAATIHWQIVPIEAADDAIGAIAVAGGKQLAVGDSRGVLIGSAPDALQRYWLRGAVRHVQFIGIDDTEARDALVVTESGLYRVGHKSGSEPIAPAPGARAASVSRIASVGGVVAIATDDGVFLSRDGQHWQRLAGTVPTGRASSVAMRQAGDGIVCWAVIRGQLWRVVLDSDPDPSALSMPSIGQRFDSKTAASRVELPMGPGGREPVDIALGIDDAEIVVVYDSTLVVRSRERDAGSGASWNIMRPELPPGAAIVELTQTIGWCWLATDRGLLRARTLHGPWVPASGPLAARPIGDLSTIGSSESDAGSDLPRIEPALYVATDRGVMVAKAGSSPESTPRLSTRAAKRRALAPNDPDIDRVQRAALDYLDLDRTRINEFHRGLDRRGWLPKVGFAIARETDRSRNWDYDEAYISGGLRGLNDRDSDRSTELELRLTLSWDLGDIAYHPERLDISREAREIIELRDEVLDEVTQLYFERQRVLAQLSSVADSEALAVRIRADQLAAGIDAWTGGWFSKSVLSPDPLTHAPNTDPARSDPPHRRPTRRSGRPSSPVPNPPE